MYILSQFHCRRKFSNRASKSASASLGPPPPAACACGCFVAPAANVPPVDGKPVKKIFF